MNVMPHFSAVEKCLGGSAGCNGHGGDSLSFEFS
jgi:hypothetical protein